MCCTVYHLKVSSSPAVVHHTLENTLDSNARGRGMPWLDLCLGGVRKSFDATISGVCPYGGFLLPHLSWHPISYWAHWSCLPNNPLFPASPYLHSSPGLGPHHCVTCTVTIASRTQDFTLLHSMNATNATSIMWLLCSNSPPSPSE